MEIVVFLKMKSWLASGKGRMVIANSIETALGYYATGRQDSFYVTLCAFFSASGNAKRISAFFRQPIC
jgi:hypothetical protein